MSDNSGAIAGVSHVGAPPSEEKTMIFNIHSFESLSKSFYRAPSIFCHGFHWQLDLHPNGQNDESRGHVSLFLRCREVADGIIESVRARYNVQVPNHPSSIRTGMPNKYSKDKFVSWGKLKCWPRHEAISYCDARGTLRVKVSLQVYPDEKEVSCWKPGKTNGTKVASLYDSKIRADAAFVIGDRRFEVHRWILDLNAPTLAGMFGDDNANQVDVPIKGADPNLFEMMIRFLYTEDLPPGFNDENDALELLQLADKFGCSNLKMLLEARIIESPQIFCLKNAADILVLAEAKNCALLLERSLKLVVENIPGIYETEGWKHVEVSTKLMKAIIDTQSNRQEANVEENASISVLRKRAFDGGLDADGSRENLIKRLKVDTDNEDAESRASNAADE